MTSNERGVTLDPKNPNYEFLREFGINDGLWKALFDFRCGSFESDGFIRWYWRNAGHWTACKSQAEFNAVARRRLADKVGYTPRRNDALNVVSQFFDKGQDLSFSDVLDAVTFCSPTEKMPFEVFENCEHAIVDVTRRKGCDSFLKIDREFLPTLVKLYPWERVEDTIIKTIPIDGCAREFNVVTLAFWSKYRNANRDEMAKAISFHSADRLDWTSGNLYSRWREGLLAERFKNRVDPVLDCDTKIPTIDARFPKKLKEGEREPIQPCRVVSVTSTGSDVFTEKPGKQSLVVPAFDGPLED